MWLKLEFPLAGEAEKQENEREGKQEANGSQFTQAEGLLAHLHVPLSPLHPLDSLQAASRADREAGDTTQQLQGEITAWLLKKRVSLGCKVSTPGSDIPLITERGAGDGSPVSHQSAETPGSLAAQCLQCSTLAPRHCSS